jgi:hypothetical protein
MRTAREKEAAEKEDWNPFGDEVCINRLSVHLVAPPSLVTDASDGHQQ